MNFDQDLPLDGGRVVALAEAARGRFRRGERPGDIKILPGLLPQAADQADDLLRAAGGTYKRGGLLVRVSSLGPESPAALARVWKARAEGGAGSESPAIVPHDVASLRDVLSRAATEHARSFVTFDRRSNDWRPADCPHDVATVLLSRAGKWAVPTLTGFMAAPTLRPDGSILQEPGYDPITGLLCTFNAGEFPRVPERPSKEDARAALDLIAEIFRDFPYVDEASRAVAFSGVLTALIRPSLETAPIHAFTAPRPRSGKSKQPRLAALIATGRLPAIITPNEDPSEEKKRLLALLMAGEPIVSIDTIDAPFWSEALCAIVTEGEWQDRLLGSNKQMKVASSSLFCVNGNNLVLRGDLNERAVIAVIDPETDRPEERSFEQPNLEAEVRSRRHELAVAGLTVLRAYVVAGGPDVGLKQWGGFEQWSEWVRSALVWLGCADPRATRFHLEKNDPTRMQLLALLSAWFEALGGGAYTTAQLIQAANETVATGLYGSSLKHQDLHDAVSAVAVGASGANRLGNFLSKYVDRVEGGLVLRRLPPDTDRKVVRWCVGVTK
ncbi:MAG: hypothetical protein IT186_12645 [Acidobacteria bacterium]|nr:hypothetical protein [Acidobacteriota bacterium]